MTFCSLSLCAGAGCTALWVEGCFVQEWGTSSWSFPQQPITGCSIGSPVTTCTRGCGATVCQENVSHTVRASVSGDGIVPLCWCSRATFWPDGREVWWLLDAFIIVLAFGHTQISLLWVKRLWMDAMDAVFPLQSCVLPLNCEMWSMMAATRPPPEPSLASSLFEMSK